MGEERREEERELVLHKISYRKMVKVLMVLWNNWSNVYHLIRLKSVIVYLTIIDCIRINYAYFNRYYNGNNIWDNMIINYWT